MRRRDSKTRVHMINFDLLKSEAEKLEVPLNDIALDRFDLLAQRLVRWNEHVNLTAITEPDEIVIKHFADSMAGLVKNKIPRGANLIDVGCGAGFPSLPMLIARPDIEVTFVDSVGKKLSFIKQYLKYAGLYGDLVHERAEVIGRDRDYREDFDVAVSRAVAPLNILAEYCMPLVKEGGLFIALKGVKNEIDIGESAIEELGGQIEQVVSLELSNGDKRNVIFVRKISHTPTKYPRKSKKIDTHPL